MLRVDESKIRQVVGTAETHSAFMNHDMTSRALALDAQRRRALELFTLHETAPLVLPNAWDAGSARVLADAGAKAVATTSGGCSWSLGLPDGGYLQRHEVIDVIRRIVRVVDVPVTADIEAGYGCSRDELVVTVRALIEAGAAGINIEDSREGVVDGVREAARRIETMRHAADELDAPLFVNARTDVFLFGKGDQASRVAEVIERGRAYAQAGANGLFVPGLLDLAALRRIRDEVNLPLNAMVSPGAPTVAALVDAGVTRISVGTALAQTAYAYARRAARELLSTGTYGALEESIGYGELNALLWPPLSVVAPHSSVAGTHQQGGSVLRASGDRRP